MMPNCGPDGKLCFPRTTGDFFLRFPLQQWFPGVFWEKGGDPGAHRAVTQEVWLSFPNAFVGMFRDPAMRVQSEYAYQSLRSPTNFSQHWDILEYAQHVAGTVTKSLAGQEDDNHCRSLRVNKCQTHLVPDVHKAVERLPSFRFVGLTDSWAESICLFHLQLGGACLPVEQVNNRAGTQEQDQNTTLLELLRVADPFDTLLFKAAVHRFWTSAAAVGLTCERCRAISCPCGQLIWSA